MRIQVQAFYYKTWSIQGGSGSSKQVWHGQDTRIIQGKRGSEIGKLNPEGKAERINQTTRAGIKHGKTD